MGWIGGRKDTFHMANGSWTDADVGFGLVDGITIPACDHRCCIVVYFEDRTKSKIPQSTIVKHNNHEDHAVPSTLAVLSGALYSMSNVGSGIC